MGQRRRPQKRHEVIGTLAGLRIGEMISLRWTDVDLARGTINVRRSKTVAGIRTIYLLPALRDHLDTLPRGDHLVFPTSTGNEQQPSNIRRRVLAPAVALANERLDDPLPTGLTPHSLRRTFASILFALGEQPPYVMQQMGHTTPNLTLALYARHMQRRDGEPGTRRRRSPTRPASRWSRSSSSIRTSIRRR